LTKTGKHVWIYTNNKMAKFYGIIFSLSENTAKSLGATFLTYTLCKACDINMTLGGLA